MTPIGEGEGAAWASLYIYVLWPQSDPVNLRQARRARAMKVTMGQPAGGYVVLSRRHRFLTEFF